MRKKVHERTLAEEQLENLKYEGMITRALCECEFKEGERCETLKPFTALFIIGQPTFSKEEDDAFYFCKDLNELKTLTRWEDNSKSFFISRIIKIFCKKS